MVGKSSLGGDPSTTNEYLVFLLFASSSFGTSLAINAWIFYRVTGGLFNPAVRLCNTNMVKKVANCRQVTFAFVLAGLMHPVKYVVLTS